MIARLLVATTLAIALRVLGAPADAATAPGAAASPVATPAAGGKGAPADPTRPAGASPSPQPPSSASANDPCGGPGRLLATLNRPTIGYSACAVPRGSLVLEEGYQNTVQRGAAASTQVTFPQGFERVGVANRLELDLIGPNDNLVRASTGATHGYNDLGLGFKYELPPAGRFTYGIDGLFTAATGARNFTGGGPTQTLDVDIAYAASPAVGIGSTLAGSASSGAIADGTFRRYGFALPSLVVTAQLPHYYQFYAEFVGQTKLAPDQGGHVFTDFGLQKLVGENVELDAEYGAEFTPVFGSRFHYLGIGTGIRLP